MFTVLFSLSLSFPSTTSANKLKLHHLYIWLLLSNIEGNNGNNSYLCNACLSILEQQKKTESRILSPVSPFHFLETVFALIVMLYILSQNPSKFNVFLISHFWKKWHSNTSIVLGQITSGQILHYLCTVLICVLQYFCWEKKNKRKKETGFKNTQVIRYYSTFFTQCIWSTSLYKQKYFIFLLWWDVFCHHYSNAVYSTTANYR